MNGRQMFGLVLATLGLVATVANWIGQGSVLNRFVFLWVTAFGVYLIWP